MKTFIAYCFGFLGFLMQGGVVIGLPAYVFFFGGSSLWLLAFFPLGFAGTRVRRKPEAFRQVETFQSNASPNESDDYLGRYVGFGSI